MSRNRIFIIEDHPLFRTGIIQLLKTEPDLEICGEAESRSEALALLESMDSPNLVLLDLSLKDSSGLELLKDIHYRNPSLPILVLSMHDENFYAERVIKAGSRGYIMKQEATSNILEAIKTVLAGNIYLSEPLREKKEQGDEADEQAGSPEEIIRNLSDRQLEIFQMISKGFGTKKIAENLNLSIKTVETHKRHIQMKLDLRNFGELHRYAIEWRNSGVSL
jgi:DNA-binding NarL/FixJ family response regulator